MLNPIGSLARTTRARMKPASNNGMAKLEDYLRLLQGGSLDPRPHGQRCRCKVRRGQEDHAARLRQGKLKFGSFRGSYVR